MSLFLIPLAALCLVGMKFSGKEFRTDYMSPQTTTAVNGVFTVLVFMCHVINTSTYQYGGLADKIFKDYINIGQLVVVTFLFFSGYGVAESLRKKPGYAKRMPYHRVFRVWISFAAALLFWILFNLIRRLEMDAKMILLSFTGWDSLGNSNWFMFVIFCLYILTCASFLICRDRFVPGTILLTALSAGLTAALVFADRGTHWWNTIVFYPLGMWYSLLKPQIEKIVQKNNVVYWLCFSGFAAMTAATHYLYIHWGYKQSVFMISGCFMMAFIITGLMKFTVCNKVLLWLGKNLFWIYILQRIPMAAFGALDVDINKYLYVLICAVITVGLTFAFSALFKPINEKLFQQKKKER
ncbi:MAG: acyltransferase [Clostridia bacterium]|nr:acyltransferase [Clostridia bacterium]